MEPASITSLSSSFFAGSFAGACGIFIGHPFDTLKVRMQVNQSLSPTFDKELVRQLYRGILPPLLTAGAMQSILFFNYEYFRVLLRRRDWNAVGHRGSGSSGSGVVRSSGSCVDSDGGKAHLSVAFIAGAFSGSLLASISTPISFVKIQQQVTSESGILAVGRECIRRGGIMSLYRGAACQVMLESPGRGVYLVTYEYVKMLLNQRQVERDNQGIPASQLYSKMGLHSNVKESQTTRMMAAAVAGTNSWICLYPFDVIKARLQVDGTGAKYKGTIDCFVKTFREGGIPALYRGLGYTIIRAAPVASTILPIYEWSKEKIETLI